MSTCGDGRTVSLASQEPHILVSHSVGHGNRQQAVQNEEKQAFSPLQMLKVRLIKRKRSVQTHICITGFQASSNFNINTCLVL